MENQALAFVRFAGEMPLGLPDALQDLLAWKTPEEELKLKKESTYW